MRTGEKESERRQRERENEEGWRMTEVAGYAGDGDTSVCISAKLLPFEAGGKGMRGKKEGLDGKKRGGGIGRSRGGERKRMRRRCERKKREREREGKSDGDDDNDDSSSKC